MLIEILLIVLLAIAVGLVYSGSMYILLWSLQYIGAVLYSLWSTWKYRRK
jgi:hypothetical protein